MTRYPLDHAYYVRSDGKLYRVSRDAWVAISCETLWELAFDWIVDSILGRVLRMVGRVGR